MIPTRTGVLNAGGTGTFFIDYSLTGDAATKSLDILVNGLNVVNCNSNCSGRLLVNSGQDVTVSSYAYDTTSILLTTTIVDGSTTLYNNSIIGSPDAGDNYGPYFPTANGSITVLAGTT